MKPLARVPDSLAEPLLALLQGFDLSPFAPAVLVNSTTGKRQVGLWAITISPIFRALNKPLLPFTLPMNLPVATSHVYCSRKAQTTIQGAALTLQTSPGTLQERLLFVPEDFANLSPTPNPEASDLKSRAPKPESPSKPVETHPARCPALRKSEKQPIS